MGEAPTNGPVIYADAIHPGLPWWLIPASCVCIAAFGLVMVARGQVAALLFPALALFALALSTRAFQCRLEVGPERIYVRGVNWFSPEGEWSPGEVHAVERFRLRDSLLGGINRSGLWAAPGRMPRCVIRGVRRSAFISPGNERAFYQACEDAGFLVTWPPHLCRGRPNRPRQ